MVWSLWYVCAPAVHVHEIDFIFVCKCIHIKKIIKFATSLAIVNASDCTCTCIWQFDGA